MGLINNFLSYIKGKIIPCNASPGPAIKTLAAIKSAGNTGSLCSAEVTVLTSLPQMTTGSESSGRMKPCSQTMADIQYVTSVEEGAATHPGALVQIKRYRLLLFQGPLRVLEGG